jgi:hypothetical protein
LIGDVEGGALASQRFFCHGYPSYVRVKSRDPQRKRLAAVRFPSAAKAALLPRCWWHGWRRALT